MASSQDPAYGKLDDQPVINLQSFRARTKYSRLPSDYDQSNLLQPSSPFRGYNETTDYVQSRPASRLSRIGHALSFNRPGQKRDYMRYVRFGSTTDEDYSDRDHKPFRGWRKAVIAAAIITSIVLTINLIFAIVALTRYGQADGVGYIYTGDCNLVKRWDTALHLLINVLGTCLLGASSFTMQCLSSPTRSEADRAHAKKVSLDVGITSFRNLFYLGKKKALLWWALALSTMPLHLLWNSTIFSTLGANEFTYYVIDERFLEGAPYSKRVSNSACQYLVESSPTFSSVYDAYKAGNYSQKLTPSECIKAYSQTYTTGRRNFLAITKPTQGIRQSPGCAFSDMEVSKNYTSGKYTYQETYYPQPLWNGSSVLAFENEGSNAYTDWQCLGFDAYVDEQSTSTVSCSEAVAQNLLAENGTWYLRPDDSSSYNSGDGYGSMQAYPIEYCLSEVGAPELCTLQYVSYILGVVVACNAIKVASMIAAAILLWDLNEPILATVGDAVGSYMETPDTTTRGWCLMDRTDIKAWKRASGEPKKSNQYNRKPYIRLFSATTKTRWWVTMCLCTLYLVVGIVLLVLSIGEAEGQYSLSQIWKLGMGAINSTTVLGVQGSTARGLILDVLIANSFQVVLSMTYFLYNSLYTAQCGAKEWVSYIGRRRALRVTYPRGQQRSTYWLHLPYHYGLPLTGMLMLLHFLISQAIFLARVQFYEEGGGVDDTDSISDVGFSPIAILVTVCVGATLILTQVAHSLRPLDGRMPVHGNSSVVISAACHPGNGSYENDQGVLMYHPEENMALRRVMWGAVQEGEGDEGIGHCSFTASVVNPPISGKRYQGLED